MAIPRTHSCLKTLTLNVRGLRGNKKRRTIFNFIRQKKHDIIGLQECHIISDFDADWWEKQITTHALYYAVGTNRRNGNIILVNKQYREKTKYIFNNDRILIIEIETKDRKFLVLNAYAPQSTEDKIYFFHKIREVMSEHCTPQHTPILLGDFNAVVDNDLDIITGRKHDQQETNSFNELINSLDLIDSWRTMNKTEREYTWSMKHPFIARRLDYIFIAKSLADNLQHSQIISIPLTDHRAVETDLTFHDYVKGPSYWKFNNSLLKDPKFIEETNELILKIENETKDIERHSRWELFKIKIKENTISYSKQKAQRTRNRVNELEKELNILEKSLGRKQEDSLVERSIKIKTELEIAAIEKADGAFTRSRVKAIDLWEKQTPYFLGIEKSRANNNTITKLKTENGEIVTKQSDVMQVQRQFYSKLYTETINEENRSNTYIADFLGPDIETPKVEEKQKHECEKQISEQEVSLALKEMKNGSAPGSDGLTTEFYKVFWSRLKTFIIESFIDSFEKGHVSRSQQRGILSLIHKGKELPRDQLTYWRPITLLNTDYKIIAKTIALRLSKTIDGLISHDQCGFIKGRNISTLLRSTDDIIDYLNRKHIPGILVGVDFQKAFDTLSKQIIKDSLKMYGFGNNFCRWIETVISKTNSCINHYGWISEPFNVERGIRQGCPLSPLLFILAAEILAIKIRNSEIKGIKVKSNYRNDQNEYIFKILQYADDTSLFLKDKEDLEKALNIFELFEHISGLKLNRNKTQAMWLGTEKDNATKPCNLKWVRQIKILGIYFRSDVTAIEIDDNWKERLSNTQKTIQSWHRRNLSIYGKILITKTFLISPYIYIMQSIGLPDHVLIEINRIMFSFIWKKKYSNQKAFEKVKRKIMTQDYDKGGLKMIDMITFQKSLLLAWIPKIVNEDFISLWKAIPSTIYNDLGGFSILDSPVSKSKLEGLTVKADNFWIKVLFAWQDLKEKEIKNTKNVYLNSGLWNNNNLQYRAKNLHMHDWIQSNIINISDVLDERGNILSFATIEDKVGKKANRILEYNALANAIQNTRRQNRLHLINNDKIRAINTNFRDKSLTKITVRHFREIINSNTLSPCGAGFWKRKLNEDITKLHWKLANAVTKESRLKVLQWKILHNIYPTKILLYKIGKADSNKCDACDMDEIDFIEHFFFTCKTINPIWKLVTTEIMLKLDTHINITQNIALLGYTEKTKHSNKINHLISLAKMCISKYRYGERTPISIIFNRELRLREQIAQH